MNLHSHYVPVLAARFGRSEKAVCGAYVDLVAYPHKHSPDPTCPDCRLQLAQDDAATVRLVAKWEERDRLLAAERARREEAGGA